MDVNAVTNSTINTSTAHFAEFAHENSKPIHTMFPKAVEEPSMMDLEDVQNFLYMMIGSEVLVQARNNNTGDTFNQLA